MQSIYFCLPSIQYITKLIIVYLIRWILYGDYCVPLYGGCFRVDRVGRKTAKTHPRCSLARRSRGQETPKDTSVVQSPSIRHDELNAFRRLGRSELTWAGVWWWRCRGRDFARCLRRVRCPVKQNTRHPCTNLGRLVARQLTISRLCSDAVSLLRQNFPHAEPGLGDPDIVVLLRDALAAASQIVQSPQLRDQPLFSDQLQVLDLCLAKLSPGATGPQVSLVKMALGPLLLIWISGLYILLTRRF